MPPQTAFINSFVVDITTREHAGSCLEKGPLVVPISYKPRKSVSFNEVVKAKKTIHIDNFTCDEIRGYWYKPDDFEIMKRDVRFEANLLENDCLIEEAHNMRHSKRGLAMYTATGAKQRSESKRRGRSIVLEEQELQREEGSNDPEYIAEIYAAASKAARSAALAAAAAK